MSPDPIPNLPNEQPTKPDETPVLPPLDDPAPPNPLEPEPVDVPEPLGE